MPEERQGQASSDQTLNLGASVMCAGPLADGRETTRPGGVSVAPSVAVPDRREGNVNMQTVNLGGSDDMNVLLRGTTNPASFNTDT